MISIYLNIIANVLLVISMFIIANKLSKEQHETKTKKSGIKLISALFLMFWAMFMSFYLIIDFNNILSGPLNVRLNFYETIKSYIFLFYVVAGRVLWGNL